MTDPSAQRWFRRRVAPTEPGPSGDAGGGQSRQLGDGRRADPAAALRGRHLAAAVNFRQEQLPSLSVARADSPNVEDVLAKLE
ncbi:hypothetical protein [Micromonospora sp. NPDC023633]|uniref:hypothetical protein n=1 Tax=Micromonospora sp. NPDC023633 TaxID=3154320 RepID=UPI0033CE4936